MLSENEIIIHKNQTEIIEFMEDISDTKIFKCKKCGMCMKPGCPAMTKNPDGTIHIDDTMCTGCGLCKDLCKFDAIELIKEGE